ncbi:MAG TPA: hypothetical protein VGF26_02045, partial [Ramlibacter sp.]
MDTRQTDAANELWRRHSEDEAVARAAQQETAGRRHHPLPGPPPYGNEQVNLMAAEIVARERERCARLVETWPFAPDAGRSELLRQLAQVIRHQP